MSNLTDKEKTILSGKNFAYIATINSDGSPQLSPVWVEVEGELVVINTTLERLKAKNMKRDPRVTVSAYDQSNPYDKISFAGEVVEMTEAGASEHIDKLSKKYQDKPFPFHTQADHRVIVKIKKK